MLKERLLKLLILSLHKILSNLAMENLDLSIIYKIQKFFLKKLKNGRNIKMLKYTMTRSKNLGFQIV